MWRDSETSEDFLNFTEVAEQIATMATTSSLLPISIGVFGGWGTGKSTVLKLVESKLPPSGQKGGPLIVHFDAWLYQGFDDARAALMEVISSDLLRLAEERKTFIDKAKSFASRINYFRGLGMIADFGIGMALGIPPGLLTTAGSAVSSLISGRGVSAKDGAELNHEANEAKKSVAGLIGPAEKRTPPAEIAAFRKEFGELLEGLETTLVVFIDNLDRCLPDTAIGTLEAIRLFLFMPRTAFVIAADEDMIRHSVARHFNDPNTAHVRDYLDKVIQVPLRVPQVGVDDLRAYMYSLFVGDLVPEKLSAVQQHLLTALQQSWSGKTFNRAEVAKLSGASPELVDSLAIADRLAPILATAPNIQGNPRIVKRLLNAVWLRRILARNRQMNVDLATLAKLAVFERCTDTPATQALYRLIMEGGDAEKLIAPDTGAKGKRPEPPQEWASHTEFVDQWRAMEPIFTDVKTLRPAAFLSRDVLAPASNRMGLSAAVRQAVEALLQVDSVNSPVGKKIVTSLSAADLSAVAGQLIEAMRNADWADDVDGIKGAVLVATASAEAKKDLQAFFGGLKIGGLKKSTAYLLKQAGLIESN